MKQRATILVELRCPMCGHEVNAGETECSQCGENVGAHSRDVTAHHYQQLVMFRNETITLGVSWTLCGLIVMFLMNMLSFTLDDYVSGRVYPVLVGVTQLLGGLWFAFGVLTFLRMLAGVYLGLILSYQAIVGLGFVGVYHAEGAGKMVCICIMALILMIIMQAHFTASRARSLLKAGIPLSTSPREWNELSDELRTEPTSPDHD